MFSGRRRRRTAATAAAADPFQTSNSNANTLLPTTFRSGDSPTARRSLRRPPPQLPTFQTSGSSTCNNFLLGGHYYPGKDKKRRHYLRRRTIWFRIFCSSPWRMGLSLVGAAYVLLWHVLVPTTELLLDYGRLLSGRHARGALLGGSSLLELLPIQQQRKDAARLREERDRLMYNDPQRQKLRNEILQDIVPDWFHRNNNPAKGQPGRPHKSGPLSNASEKGDEPSEDQIAMDARRERHKRAEDDESLGENSDLEKAPLDVALVNNVTGKEPQPTRNAIAAANGTDTGATKPLSGVTNDAKEEEQTNKDNATVAVESRKSESPKQRTLFSMDTFPSQSSCPSDLSVTNLKTTLVMQSSLDRLWILSETCSRWKDPIVTVVYVSAPDNTTDSILQSTRQACPQLTLIRYDTQDGETHLNYPVNHLRNLGLDAVSTSHVLVVDIDLVPSTNLDRTIQSTLLDQPHLMAAEREAIVVPAFERIPPEPCTPTHDCTLYLKNSSSFLPSTLDDLRKCVDRTECAVFQQNVNWDGHHSTRSKSWLQGEWYDTVEVQNKTRKLLRQIPCFESLRYEPYVLLRWCPVADSREAVTPLPIKPVAPYYDERFYGYGKNKIQMISHLRFMGYRFSVLPAGFIVHNPHTDSATKQAWDQKKEYDLHDKMDELYNQYLKDVYRKYKETTDYIVRPCDVPQQKGKKKKSRGKSRERSA